MGVEVYVCVDGCGGVCVCVTSVSVCVCVCVCVYVCVASVSACECLWVSMWVGVGVSRVNWLFFRRKSRRFVVFTARKTFFVTLFVVLFVPNYPLQESFTNKNIRMNL